MPPAALHDAVADRLASRVTTSNRVMGGDVAEAYRFELDDGRIVFVKTHRSPPPGFFTTEAAGLSWLRIAGVVAVPEVLAVSDGEGPEPPLLALAWIDVGGAGGGPSPSDDARFGRQLAALHRAGSEVFGRTDRRTTGSRRLPNEPCASWVEFYASQRLHPLVRLAGDASALDDRTLRRIETVADQLAGLGGPGEPPARLHGDLWAGNRLVDAGGTSWLIDPAAHGGHREFDLAMMRLFGGFGSACFGAYAEEYPLADGWQQRVPLHQLAPLIVHAVKFGGGYRDATARALDAVLGG